MARTSLTVQTTDRDGLTTSYTAGDAANGHDWINTQKEIIHIKNDGGVGITATFITQQTVDGLAVADKAVSVGAGVHMFIGPFSNDIYGLTSGSDKLVQVDLDTAASVTVAVMKVGSI